MATRGKKQPRPLQRTRQRQAGGDAVTRAEVPQSAPGLLSALQSSNKQPLAAAAADAGAKAEVPFSALGLSAAMQGALTRMGLTTAKPVQVAAIPKALAGMDVFAKASTGSGKTIGFAVPTIELLARAGTVPPGGPFRAVVLSPARELALQTHAVFERLLASFPGIGAVPLVGGTSKPNDVRLLTRGPADVLIATPGRLLDHLQTTPGVAARLAAGVRVLVLDEADTMLDSGFLNDILKVTAALPRERLNLLFTATVPPFVADVARKVMRPGYLVVDVTAPGDANAASHPQIKQEYAVVRPEEVFPALHAVVRAKRAANNAHRIIVFFPTTSLVHFAAALFRGVGRMPDVLEVHSDLSQAQRTRAADEFRNNAGRVLFASDVLGRGVDFPEVTTVVQVGLTDVTTYEHRIGRTGRAGRSGEALYILSQPEAPFLQELQATHRALAAAPDGPRAPFPPFPPIADPKLAALADAAFRGTLGFLASRAAGMRCGKRRLHCFVIERVHDQIDRCLRTVY